MQVQATPFFSTPFDSTFDAESIDTKIDNFGENFQSSDIDGRSEFLPDPSPSDLLYSPAFTKHIDPDFNPQLSSKIPNSIITTNLNNNSNYDLSTPKIQPLLPKTDVLPPHLQSDDDEPDNPDSDFNDHGTEIILKAGTHYDPIDTEQNPNPLWFIISADPISEIDSNWIIVTCESYQAYSSLLYSERQ